MHEVIIKNEEKTEHWDKEVLDFRGGLFMMRAWLKCISNDDVIPVFFKFFKGVKTVALAAGIDIKMGKGKSRQLFFYTGIAFESSDPLLSSECKKALYRYAFKNGYYRITLRSYDNHTYIPLKVNGFKKKRGRAEYIFRLHRDKEHLIKSFSKKVRRRARKAKENGAVLQNSYNPDLTDTLFKFIEHTYHIRQSKGYGAYSWLFLPFFSRNEIKRLVASRHAAFYYTRLDNRILSINLLLTYNNMAYGILMGTSPEGYAKGSPSFHYFELVKTLKDKGYRYYNLGGAQSGPQHRGLKKFKDSLGSDKIYSAEEFTNFINKPLCFLNPLLEIKWFILHLGFTPWKLKKVIIDLIDLVIKNRDRY